MRFTIGEFSRLTELSVKTLRLYHDKGILEPAKVDEFTGYRYYDEGNLETARSIKALRGFDFTLAEIKELLSQCDEESDMLEQLERKLRQVDSKIDRYRDVSSVITSIIASEKEKTVGESKNFEIEEREIETMLIAGHRMTGKYEEVGKGLGLVCRKMGRHMNGKPMTLYYDGEYKEEGADFEPSVPVRKGKDVEGISVRELKGGRCVSLIHKGPYDTIHESYKRIFSYCNEKGYETILPTREIYKKGPGLILKGNPKNYLTEIQVLIEEK